LSDLVCEKSEGVWTLTLHRPERMNAISGPMLRELSARLWEADRAPGARCVILTGAGRGFCAGLDLKDVAGGQGELAGADGMPGGGLDLANAPPVVLRRIDVPVICALNGPAAGYGMDLALGCDIVLASDRARLAPPVRRGVVPESGGTWLLPRLVGWHRACEISLLARPLDAQQMRELGLANRVVPHDQLLGEARAWAGEIAANAPLAVAATKRTMRLGLDSSFDAHMYHVTAELLQLLRTRDFREGLQAFLEKRDPRYEGR
jgi:enoyl-CoA hydratase/carnithine racemase